ncbi:MAG: hypothetical protein IJU69_04530 [Bacteroidales bacterium]|nr:hypothetical protein [Bacteroidales bacterium]
MIFTADIVFPVSSQPVRDGFLECASDGTVTGFGPQKDLSPEALASAVKLDGFLVPGFTNAHCHIELSHMKGLFREATGMDGFIRQINELRLTVDREGRIAAMREAFDDRVDQGVRAMGDISNCDESFAMKAEALADGRMYTRTFLEVFGTEPEDAGAVIEGAMALQAEARSMGLDAAPSPHACYTMSRCSTEWRRLKVSRAATYLITARRVPKKRICCATAQGPSPRTTASAEPRNFL